MSKNLTQAQLDKLWDRTSEEQTLLVADYSSLEIGIQGDLCYRLFGDDQLIKAYDAQFDPKNPVDLHSNNAREVFGTWLKWKVPEKMKGKKGDTFVPKYAGERVDKIPVREFKEHPFGEILRDMIKAIWYGLAYGKRGYGFQTLQGADGKEIGLKLADMMVEALLDAVPCMREWDRWVWDYVKEHSGIYSLGGRWCDLKRECSTGDEWDLKRAVRRALNFPMQATGAEIIGDAMVRVMEDLIFRATGFRICLQVHDELVARGPKRFAVKAQSRLIHGMETATANGVKLHVKVRVSSKIAPNYAECK